MKKSRVFTIQDGLTGEVVMQVDNDILSNNVISCVVEDMFERVCMVNEHDLFIKVGFRP